MIAFIDDHRAVYGVEPICRVLPIAPSTYHEHAARKADPDRRPARERRDADLSQETVTAVAYRWGFSSASRFSAYYRETYGVSPKQTLEYR